LKAVRGVAARHEITGWCWTGSFGSPAQACSGVIFRNILVRWGAVYRQFRRWTQSGLWELLLEGVNESGVGNHTLQMIDSTVIRAHHCAAGAKGGLKKRLLAVQDVAS
jgi:transposase